MAMTSLSIVLTVVVLQLHHVGPNQKPVPRWIKRIMIDFFARVLCMSNYITNYYGDSRRRTRDADQPRQHAQRRHNGHQRHRLPTPPLQRGVTSSQYSNLLTSSSQEQLQDFRPAAAHQPQLQSGGSRRDSSDCNGDVKHSSIPLLQLNTHNLDASDAHNFTLQRRASRAREQQVGEEMSNHLRIMVAKRAGEDEHEDIVNEWRLVAHICDRLLFFIFLVSSLVSTVYILVLMPRGKPQFDADDP